MYYYISTLYTYCLLFTNYNKYITGYLKYSTWLVHQLLTFGQMIKSFLQTWCYSKPTLSCNLKLLSKKLNNITYFHNRNSIYRVSRQKNKNKTKTKNTLLFFLFFFFTMEFNAMNFEIFLIHNKILTLFLTWSVSKQKECISNILEHFLSSLLFCVCSSTSHYLYMPCLIVKQDLTCVLA